MYQYFRRSVAAAALNAGTGAGNQRKTAMEADIISKHGRSSKSQMSRGNLIFLVAVITLFSAATVSCDWLEEQTKTIDVTGVTLNETSVSIEIGGTLTLVETVAPEDATEKGVTWASSNSNVASVQNGVVTGVSAGSATITVTTNNGNKTATCQVTVSPKIETFVYVAGSEGNRAVLWVNGQAQYLTDGTVSTQANSVFVSGNDVYVAGFETGNNGTAKLWRNGELQNLATTGNLSHALSVYVAGNDVYVAGYQYYYDDEHDMYAATVWRNGVSEILAGPYHNWDWATSVFVSGSNVHVVGTGYWRNGALQNILTWDTRGTLNSVFVEGSDIYIVGGLSTTSQNTSIAALIKNGTRQNLTNGTRQAVAEDVFVTGSNVYVVGRENNQQGNSVATLWTNNQPQTLTNGSANASANSVHVQADDVYVAGHDGNRAVLWKNGTVQNLTTGSAEAKANSVFVVVR